MNIVNKFKKRNLFLIFFCFIISFIMLMLCSKCSFLYPFNGWDDFNSFYTIGSSWANGLMPYRDLFEQKGPLLYLIFMIGYLISPGKFIGVFLIEVLFLTLNLYFSSKIIDLLIDDRNNCKGKCLILFLYTMMLTTSVSFVTGGSSEEFNLLFVTISVFYFIKYFKNSDLINISYKDLIICGLCCGLSLMIKYTTVGLWFIMMAYVCIKLISLKKIKDSFLKGIVFIVSMFVPFLIFSIYFYINDSLFDFLNVYFYINIFKYSSDMGIFINIFKSFSSILSAFFSNIPMVIVFYLVFCYFLYHKWKFNYKFKFNKKMVVFWLMILFSLIVLYYGQQFWPYAITSMFVIVLLVIIYLYKKFGEFKLFKILSGIYIFSSLIFLIDYDYMFVDKREIVQYRFADIINKYDDASLLHYRSIDEGFYTTSGILPKNKYFSQVNMSVTDFSDSYLEQDDIIRNKDVMFVVVRKFDMDRHGGYMDLLTDSKKLFNQRADLNFINEYYELVDEYHNSVGYYNSCIYYLFKVRD